jgi:hypothetical protein
MQINYEKNGSDCLFVSVIGLGVYFIINTDDGGWTSRFLPCIHQPLLSYLRWQ